MFQFTINGQSFPFPFPPNMQPPQPPPPPQQPPEPEVKRYKIEGKETIEDAEFEDVAQKSE